MNQFIVFTVVALVAIWGAGAEPPQFRTFKYVHPAQPEPQPQFGQQQVASSAAGYAPAGPPTGQLLLVPGEYVVKYNAPYSEYGAPEQPQFVPQPVVAEQYNYQQQQQFATAQDPNYYNQDQQVNQQGQQFGQYNAQQGQYIAPAQQPNQAAAQSGQYNAQTEYQQPQFGQRVAPKQSPAPFGQYNAQQGQYNAPGQQPSQAAAPQSGQYNNAQQFGQYNAQAEQQPNQAAVQSGQYNAQQGQYNAPRKQPSQAAAQSGQYNNAQQFGQYNAQAEQPRVAPKQSPAPFGQLKVQKGKFSGQLNLGEQAEEQQDADAEQQDQPEEDQSKAKTQRGNVKFNKQAKQPEQVDEQYQQGRYVQRGNSRYTSPKSQVELIKTNGNQEQAAANNAEGNSQNDDDDDDAENDSSEFSGRYTQQQQPQQFGKYTAPSPQQQPQEYTPSRTFFFGRYTQPSDAKQADVQSEYSKVNKYVPPKARGKATTETPETSTEDATDSTTTEVGPTVAYDPEAKENYTNDKEETEDEAATKAANGFYYLLLPDGKLQKIVYMTEEDLKKMAFVARLQYQNVEPIQGPVYSYNPESSPFVQVF